MSQQIRVLQCFDCKLFQVDIVKKANKWQCKVCNAKQSTGREYLRGSGPQCRLKAQELNMKRAEKQQIDENNALELLKECEEQPIQITNEISEEPKKLPLRTTSKWAAFAETTCTSNIKEVNCDNEAQWSKPKPPNKKVPLNYCSTKNPTRKTLASKREPPSTNTMPNPKKQCSKWQDYV